MTLKEVRQALRQWGRFWAEKEMGLGFSSRSITATMMEVGALGISARSDKHLYSHGSAGIFVPDHINEIDKVVNIFLTIEEKKLVRAVYIQKRALTEKGIRSLLKIEQVLSFRL